MKLNKGKTAFGRHETFPLRYGWLTKGVEAVDKHRAIFQEREHEGSGSNLKRVVG